MTERIASGVRSILLVEVMGGLGDLIMALPVAHALAASHRGARLSVVALAPWHELLLGDPGIHEVVPVADQETPTVRAAVELALAGGPPDLAITTSRRHELPELLEERATHAVTNLWQRPPADQLVDVRYLELLARAGAIAPEHVATTPRVHLSAAEVAEGRALLDELAPAGRPVLLMPDSGMAVKRWPLERWQALVGGLRAAGDAPIVIGQDARLVEPIAVSGAVPAPQLPLRALAALTAAAAERDGRAVGGDTGPVRLATATGLHAVGLFGPTLASRYGSRPELAVDLQGLPGCEVRTPTAITEQVCWWSAECPLTGGGAPACMADIGVAAVLDALAR